MSNRYIFVIDTDEYAGNFEREMTAYITGIIGDCGVGEEFVNLYIKETGDKMCSRFSMLLEQRTDDTGCSRPCSIWDTKGWLYDRDAGAVRKEDFNQEEANKLYRIKMSSYYQEQLERTKKIDLTDPNVMRGGWNEKSKLKEINRLQKEIDRCLRLTTICDRIEPTNSVAIFFYNKPTKKLIDFMKIRANKFADAKRNISDFNWDKEFEMNIVGFRLLKETTSLIECVI